MLLTYFATKPAKRLAQHWTTSQHHQQIPVYISSLTLYLIHSRMFNFSPLSVYRSSSAAGAIYAPEEVQCTLLLSVLAMWPKKS